tara:strand:+ start:201 stop:878 length:678 start_codon:yes stop_codon:yes gene_type:complete
MITDIDGKLEVFIITNGRSTFEYCQNSIQGQLGVKFKTTIHRDMDWLTANKRILDVCKSEFFVRVDDDMLLHPRAISFMFKCVSHQSSRCALRGWKLWEPYSVKVIKGVKAYNLELAKDIGFRISAIGKIDKVFSADAKRKRKKIIYTEDIVGIHSCSTFPEHLQYAIMRGENKGDNFKQEKMWMKKVITGCKLSLRKQAKMSDGYVRRLNKKNKSGFYKFLKHG